MNRLYRSLGTIAFGWLLGSCGGGGEIAGPPPPPPPTTASITVSPGSGTLVPAATVQLTAAALDASGQQLQRTFTWASSDLSKATVNSSGVVTGVAAGSATITAGVDGKTGTLAVSVLDGGVVSSAGGTLTLESGLVQLVLPADAVASSLNLSVVPSIAMAADPRVVKGTAFDFGPVATTFAKPVTLTLKYDRTNLPPGTDEAALEIYLSTTTGWEVVPGSVVDISAQTVTAQLSHFSTYAILIPDAITTITISGPPANPIVSDASSVLVGDSEQLAVTVRNSAGGVLSHRAISWTSSDATIVSVTADGLITALTSGSATITAAAGGKSSSVLFTVTPVPVATVAVSPPSASVVAGSTQQLSATLTDSHGSALTGRTVSWQSDHPEFATVSPTGLVTGVAAGTAHIIVTSEGKNGTSTITVTPAPVNTVIVTPPTGTLVLGVMPTQQLSAQLKDVNGTVLSGRVVTWASSAPAVATVDANGLVMAVAAGGPVTITATSEGKTGTSSITVSLDPVNTVTVTPPNATLVLGVTPTQQLAALLKDVANNVLNGRLVTWSSNNTAVATVDANGLVMAVGAGGPATITATSEEKSGTSSITVTVAPVNTVTVTPPTATLVLGVTPTQQLTAVLKDVANHVLSGRVVTWTSSAPTVATVDVNGLVTAVAAGGPVTITATSEGKSETSSITVALDPVNTVIVTPPTGTLVLGVMPTQQLSAQLKDVNGTVLSGRVVTWASNTGVATVDANGLVTAVAAGGPVTITATSEGKAGTSSITATLAPVNTVTVAPPTATLVLGVTPVEQLTVVVKDVANNVLSGRVVTWSSSNTAVATVDENGLVTAVGAGDQATITATSEGKIGTSSVTVALDPVNTVIVTPPSATLVLGVTPTEQLSAQLKDINGNVLTRPVTWTSSAPGVASVDANGLVTAIAAGGPVTITASREGKSGTSSITVTLASVNTVTVTPPTATLVLGVTPSQQLTAVLKDVANNVLSGRLVTWTSSAPTVATVDENGLVTAVGAGGPATITATSEEKTGSSAIAVTIAPVNTVTVTPPTATLVLGVTPTQQLTAVLKDVANTTLSGRVVTWTSSAPALATVDANGLVTAVSAGGPVTITATSEGKGGTSSVTVALDPVNTVTVTPPTATLVLGVTPTQQLSAELKDINDVPLTDRTVTWVSDDPAVATVDANGLVTAVGAGGPATITATSEGKSGTSSITVTVAPVNTVTLTPPTATLVLGVTPTQQLTTVLKDVADNVLSGRLVTWSSNNTGVATVDANGLVTAVRDGGPVTITATSEAKTATSSITVTVAPVNSVTVSPATATLVLTVTPTQQLTAVLKDVANHMLNGRVVTWTSSAPTVATVDGSGLVTGLVAGGPVTITATSEEKTGTTSITVMPIPVATVTISAPGTIAMVVGGTQSLTAVAKDASTNVLTGRVVTWASSNPSVLSVSPTGSMATITAVGQGTATIAATSEGVSSTPTPVITVANNGVTGVLHVSTDNGRYFADPTGRIIYLTGSHFWKNVQDDGLTDPPAAFDNNSYLNSLQSHNHNFTRLWVWEQSKWSSEVAYDHWFSPTLYVRTGPETGADGGLKFDLNQINPDYLTRLRQRVIDAGARGIYVSVMLFDGWSVEEKGDNAFANPWLGHPFNSANNINGINGDPNGDLSGRETQQLAIPAVTSLQEAYVRAVVDAVNDLDNVIYEISNESDGSADSWQYHMISFIRSYEATKPKHHPIGMSVPFPGTNAEVTSSAADWVSLDGDVENPVVADGSKVSLTDTDHLCGICGNVPWVWKSLMTGHNPLLMDGYDDSPGVSDPNYDPADAKWEAIRKNLGYARTYANKMDLAHAVPHGELAGSGYCLAVPGSQYLIYAPGGFSVTAHLGGALLTDSFTVEWFNPTTGASTVLLQPVAGGGNRVLEPPTTGDEIVFLLKR